MKRMKVSGQDVQSVTLKGQPSCPEPVEFRVEFPGGYIYVARDNPEGGGRPAWWIHAGVFHANHPDKHRTVNLDEHGDPGPTAKIVDGRVDRFDRGATETIPLAAALTQPNVDHVAIRIQTNA